MTFFGNSSRDKVQFCLEMFEYNHGKTKTPDWKLWRSLNEQIKSL